MSDAYKKASWMWLLAEGGVPSYYGGYEMDGADYNRFRHVRRCGIDLADSTSVATGFESEFGGTFTDHDEQVESVYGFATCKCGEVQRLHLCIKKEMTMGEMVQKILSYDGEDQ